MVLIIARFYIKNMVDTREVILFYSGDTYTIIVIEYVGLEDLLAD